jgi:hypothetical protein
MIFSENQSPLFGDLGQQFFLLGRRRRLGLFLADQMAHRPDRQEQREGDDDEVERDRQEMSVRQNGALLLRLG